MNNQKRKVKEISNLRNPKINLRCILLGKRINIIPVVQNYENFLLTLRITYLVCHKRKSYANFSLKKTGDHNISSLIILTTG